MSINFTLDLCLFFLQGGFWVCLFACFCVLLASWATSGEIILWEYENGQDPDHIAPYEIFDVDKELDVLSSIKTPSKCSP